MNPSVTFWNLMVRRSVPCASLEPLTHILLQAYDYAGSWSTTSDDQANLYLKSQKSSTGTDTAVSWYIANGAPASKINMGGHFKVL